MNYILFNIYSIKISYSSSNVWSRLGWVLRCLLEVRCSLGLSFSSNQTFQLQNQENSLKMGRMHAPGKGISSSALPYRRTPPSWMKTSPAEVVDQICKLAKKGLTPSQIGVVLRDSQGIAQVKSVTGNKVLRILKSNGLGPEIPEDLYQLIKKAVQVRKHLERNRKVLFYLSIYL